MRTPHAHQRPKLERYDETLLLVLKTVNYVPRTAANETGRSATRRQGFRGHRLATANTAGYPRVSDDADPNICGWVSYGDARDRRLRGVDHYLEVTNLRPISTVSRKYVRKPPALRHRTDLSAWAGVVELRRCVNPLSTVFQRMQTRAKTSFERCGATARRRHRLTEAADQIASYDDMLNSLVVPLARVGINMDMRKISAWAGIAVPTMIAGNRRRTSLHARVGTQVGLPDSDRRDGPIRSFLYHCLRNRTGSSFAGEQTQSSKLSAWRGL